MTGRSGAYLRRAIMEKQRWYGMHQRDNRLWLKRFIKHFNLTRRQIAEAVGVNISTVDRWLIPDNRGSHRNMPNMARKLLTYMVDAGDIGS
jgi:hypothetical protein